eukprot:TRINITY_DN6771_c0_g1_i1.p1 TRINITY_DN6771_c0_g1~~TRINITY_DN6771_c0_g1_i1.p1  ORF type:complete len:135 (-),score=23.62 TRINITY_DN6771_c0_g1_i1:74-478(-)
MLLLLLLMFKNLNAQFVGVTMGEVLEGENDEERCEDLGSLQIECAKQGLIEISNCLTKFVKTPRTWDGCQAECQKYQDSENPCLFYVFESMGGDFTCSLLLSHKRQRVHYCTRKPTVKNQYRSGKCKSRVRVEW